MAKIAISVTGLTKKTGLTASEIKKIVLNCCHEINHTLQELSIVFVNTEKMIILNSEYLNHNFSTDILTFDLSDAGDGSEGEIIICVNEAELNANKYKVSTANEIARLVIHGILHLNGLNDSTPKERGMMRRKENVLLKKVFINE